MRCLGLGLGLWLLLGFSASAQSAYTSGETRYLVLDVHPALGGFRRYRFFRGDELHFKANGQVYREELYDLTDSTFSILMPNEIMERDEPVTFHLRDVQHIRLHKRIPFLTQAGTIFPLAGVVYVAADFVNNQGYFDPKTLPVAGALIGSGSIFHLMSNRTVRINKNRRLRVFRTK